MFKLFANKFNNKQEGVLSSLDDRETLCRNIRTTLTRIIEKVETTQGKQLVVWLDCGQQIVFAQYDNDEYRDLILKDLATQRGYMFEKLIFEKGTPPQEKHAFKVGDNNLEYLLVEECAEVETTTTRKATLRFISGKISPLEKEYELSSEDITSGKISAYNIGRGRYVQKEGVFRENHIIIDDSLDSPLLDYNRCVSRHHAHIGFDATKGFFFQVDEGGAHPGKTAIINGGRQIECNCLFVQFQLHDGDVIILKNDDEIETILMYNELNS